MSDLHPIWVHPVDPVSVYEIPPGPADIYPILENLILGVLRRLLSATTASKWSSDQDQRSGPDESNPVTLKDLKYAEPEDDASHSPAKGPDPA